MKIKELAGFYVGYNEEEDFRILIAANDLEDAERLAEEYAEDVGFEEFEVNEYDGSDLNFDCDYVVVGG